MASAVHASTTSYLPPPSFSQQSTQSSINSASHSHSTMNSFEATQPSDTTPTLTPSMGRQPYQGTYMMSNYNGINGTHNHQLEPQRQYQAPPAPMAQISQQQQPQHQGHQGQQSKQGQQQQQQQQGQKAQIYTAVYSGVSVYETEINGLAVMRRRADSWLNATQILKLAGIDKGKRTKVLEKEILSGEHEKVQGGYGKYQGTWISYQRGVEFARGYGVEEQLRPLLEYDMGQDGISLAGSGTMATPTKEQAMAAQRKRNILNGGADARAPSQSPNGTFFKNLSKSAANAVSAISKARIESPASRSASVSRPVMPARHASQQMQGSQDSAYMPGSQQSMHSLHSEPSFGNSQLDPALRTNEASFFHEQVNGDEPPRKRVKASFNQDTAEFVPNYDVSMKDATPSQISFNYAPPISQPDPDYITLGLPPLKQPLNDSALEKQQLLSSLFFDPSQTDFSEHPALTRLSGEDLDIPIDQTAHTALHWAATLARTSLLKALTKKGANIYRLNGGGETALVRAALTTNNLDQGSFPELLEVLGPTIEIRDGRGRTVLHHIAVSSAVKGPKRSSACRYYLESLLEYVVRSGSAANSQANSFQDPAAASARPIGLARFMSEIVNATDVSGDTALNLAARVGNKSIIQQLLEVGANPTIANRGGLCPTDFGVANDYGQDMEVASQMNKSQDSPTSRVVETSQELVTTLKSLISTTSTSFTAQMTQKQSLIESTHTKLRESTSLLANERRRFQAVQQRSSERKALSLRIANLKESNEQQRTYLTTASENGVPGEARPNIQVGEADAGLEIHTAALPSPATPSSAHFTDQQRQYLATLPTPHVLHARIESYKRINNDLEGQKKTLQLRSSALEEKLRKIVSLCTGVEEGKVDHMVGALGRAIQSERAEGIEVGRVREFLRRVEGVEA